MQLGLALVAYDKMSGIISGAAGKAVSAIDRMTEKIRRASESLAEIGTASKFMGDQIIGTLQRPITEFAAFEDAATQLKTTLMRDGGVIPETFSDIEKVATSLGNQLPGTTADFFRMASAMNALGVSDKALVGGTLEAAAKLGAVLKNQGVTYEEAAINAAKFKEALGIDEKDMVAFMDLVQRTAHLGVRVDEMRYSFAKLGGTLKDIGAQGLGSSKELTPLIGMLIKMGRSGEEVGTGLATIINTVQDIKKVGEVNKDLAKFGIQLDFIDKQTGKFLGIQNLILQLDKLKNISPNIRFEVFKKLFGGQGGDTEIAKIIANAGAEGYNKMVDEMLKQASLEKRVGLTLGTLSNLYEAFTGTLANGLAAIGSTVEEPLKNIVTRLNEITGKMIEWIEKNKELVKNIVIGTMAIGGFLSTFGSLSIGLSIGLRAIGFVSDSLVPLKNGLIVSISYFGKLKDAAKIAWNVLAVKMPRETWLFLERQLIVAQMGLGILIARARQWIAVQWRMITVNAASITSFKDLAVVLWGSMVSAIQRFTSGIWRLSATLTGGLWNGLKTAVLGFRALSVAMLTNPITWLVTAFIVGTVLIYKYWSPIAGFFRGLWNGIKAGLSPLIPAWGQFGQAATKALSFIIGPIKAVYKWFTDLLTPVKDVGGAAENFGFKLGKAIGDTIVAIPKLFTKIKDTFTAIINWLAGLVTEFAKAGANMGIALANGITGPLSSIKNKFLAATNFIGEFDAKGVGMKNELLTEKAAELLKKKNQALPQIPQSEMLGPAIQNSGAAVPKNVAAGIEANVGKTNNAMNKMAGDIDNYLPHSPAKTGPLRNLDKVRIVETIAEGVKSEPLVAAIARTMDDVRKAIDFSVIIPESKMNFEKIFTGISDNIARTMNLEDVKSEPLVAVIARAMNAAKKTIDFSGIMPESNINFEKMFAVISGRASRAATPELTPETLRYSITNQESVRGNINLTYSPNITIQGAATSEDKESFAKLLKDHTSEIVKIVTNVQSRKERLGYA